MTMIRYNINDATSQYDRWLPALKPGYAKVDGRSYQQLLDFSAQFGRLIYFYNLEDNIDGNWVGFFLSDPVILAAVINTINVDEQRRQFHQLLKQTRESSVFSSKFNYFSDSFRHIVELARLLDGGFQGLGQAADNASVTVLKTSLQVLIEKQLAGKFHKLIAHAAAAACTNTLNKAIELDISGFSHCWSLSCMGADDSIYVGATKNHKIDNSLSFLELVFDIFIDVIMELQNLIRQILSGMDNYAEHRPQIALYMAFARLFHHAQNSINTISQRYINFYYKNVLRMKPADAIGDKVYLNFTLADDEGVSSTVVPETTLFDAGQAENGEAVLYQADNSLLVSSAQLARLQTLHVDKAALFEDDFIVNRRVLASEIDLTEMLSGNGLSWPTFGSLALDTYTDIQTTVLAKLGFAISSEYLLLTGGIRKVTLEIIFSQDYYQTVLQPMLKALEQKTGVSQQNIFLKVLDAAFILYASTELSWFEIVSYSVAVGNQSNSFKLVFTLDTDAPPLMAYDVDYDPANAEVNDDEMLLDIPPDSIVTPTIKSYLRQEPVQITTDVSIYPLSLLGQLQLDKFTINTNVTGLSGLSLSNTDGEIDPASPFLVFGGLPVVGSYLQVSHEELFVKTPSSLDFTIEWFNLPQDDTGFKGYYRYYDIGLDGKPERDLFDNKKFIGEFSIVNPGDWFLQLDKLECDNNPLTSAEVYLFRSKVNDKCSDSPPRKATKLCSDTIFNELKVCTINQLPEYYDPTQSAIRLTLTNPDYAFGNSLYAKNVLNAVIEDLPDTDRCTEKCEIQCQGLENLVLALDECLSNCMVLPTLEKSIYCIKQTLESFLNGFAQDIMTSLRRSLSTYIQVVGQQEVENIKTLTQVCLRLKEEQRNKMKQWDPSASTSGDDGFIPPSIESFKNRLYQYMLVYKALIKIFRAIDSFDPGTTSWQQLEQLLIKARETAQTVYEDKLTKCMNDCMAVKQELKYPNEPYLPQAVNISINYQASEVLFDSNSGQLNDEKSAGLFFHLLPFSGYQCMDLSALVNFPLLPQFDNPGYLYLGFSGLISPQWLTLLFEMSESPGTSLPSVQWNVLSDNNWQALNDAEILSDTTNGLQNIGIVSLNYPAIDNMNNTVLSDDYSWLQATVTKQARAFPNTIAIYPHALLASLFNVNSLGDFTREPLPAGTITSSVETLADISQINQPMTSYGGRPPQTHQQFEIAMGERLRHKDRAIQAWDYERLVLERFPNIWKVKALCAHNKYHGHVPGDVLLVVIPGPDSEENLDATTPMASNAMLHDIQQYIASRASPFLTLTVSNPIYVRITVTASVIFISEQDTGDYIELLNNELINYLSPWFYDEARAAKGGDYVNAADISAFIQNLDFVAELVSMDLCYSPKIEKLSTDWFFLTSSQSHNITSVTEQACPGIEFSATEDAGVCVSDQQIE